MPVPNPGYKIIKIHCSVVLFIFLMFFSFEGVSSENTTSNVPPTKAISPKISLPIFEIPVPQNKWEKNYLGVSGVGKRKVTRIKSPIIIIEVFDMYCIHCQSSAPFVNELFQTIQNRPELSKKIKIIGIGQGNSPYEVASFKNKYAVPFPLFPDQDRSISKMLGVSATPAFIGARINKDGTTEQFYFKTGRIRAAAPLLSEILKLSESDGENQ